MQRFVWLECLWHDLRHGLRVLAKSPAFTLVAVVSIAFGTGANVAIFSAADALLLRPLAVPHPDEVVTVGSLVKRGIATISVASYPDYLDIRSRARTFDGLVASTSRATGFSASAREPAQVKMLTLVSANFFRVLGVAPIVGRDFRDDEDSVPGRDAVVVLSYGLWQDQFNRDPAIVGRTVRVGGVPFEVIGVAPDGFSGVEARDVRNAAYVPLAMWPRLIVGSTPDLLHARDFRALTVKGRLRPRVSVAEAQAELTTIAKDLERAYPDTNRDQTLTVQTEIAVKIQRNPLDAALVLILTILSTAVLAVACANVAGLLVSRAPVRAREIALRLAIGAGRMRVVRQLMTESLAIAVGGAIAGLGVGKAGIALMGQIQFPTEVVAVPEMRLDQRALIVSLALAIICTFLFGIGPAFYTTRVDLAGALKATDASRRRRTRLTSRSVLSALQVALSLVLLTIAAFTYQMFQQELTAGPGFRTSHMAKVTLDAGQAHYTDVEAAQFFERAAGAARQLPGVQSATVLSAMPLFSMAMTGIAPEGFHLPDGQSSVRVCANSVDESYFETMAIPIVAGRPFRATDTPDAPSVAIVNDTLARHYWPDGSAIGRRFQLVDGRGTWVEIVGVARTTQYWYTGEAPLDAAYFPYRQQPRGNMVLLAQTTGDSASALAPLRDMIRKLDADVPVYEVQTIELFYDTRVTSLGNVIIRMIGGMGIMGVILTMVGLYGLVAYAVSRRTREIGIRMAIGASYARVLGMVLRQGLVPAWVGLVIGLALSAETASLLPRIVPLNHRFDPWTFLLVVPALVGVMLVAAFVPARRAARVDPTTALRCD